MNVYVDTNVIVARLVNGHVHQVSATSLFQQVQSRRWTPVIAAHGLAEVYSVLTRAPYRPRIAPAEAWQMIVDNVLPRFETGTLNSSEYRRIIQDCAAQGWGGGRIFDALHVATARKAQCSRIYTFDVAHFRQLAPDLLDRILAP